VSGLFVSWNPNNWGQSKNRFSYPGPRDCLSRTADHRNFVADDLADLGGLIEFQFDRLLEDLLAAPAARLKRLR